MSSVVRSSYSSRQTRTAGGVTRSEEKCIREARTATEGTRREDTKLTVKMDGLKVSEEKLTKNEKVPGLRTRSLKDANDNDIEKNVAGKNDISKKLNSRVESKGAEAGVDLKAEAAKRRQRTTMNIEQRMMEQKQRKAAEQKKRVQGRQAFKAQLESNAPARGTSNKSSFKRAADSNIEKLLRWTQNLTYGYPGVEVTDFSASWADGLAFCAVLNSLCPGEFPLDKMSEDDRKVNLDLAFEFASKKGVPPLIESADILRTKHPEPRSMVTYLHTIYKVLVADKAEKEKAAKNGEDGNSGEKNGD